MKSQTPETDAKSSQEVIRFGILAHDPQAHLLPDLRDRTLGLRGVGNGERGHLWGKMHALVLSNAEVIPLCH